MAGDPVTVGFVIFASTCAFSPMIEHARWTFALDRSELIVIMHIYTYPYVHTYTPTHHI